MESRTSDRRLTAEFVRINRPKQSIHAFGTERTGPKCNATALSKRTSFPVPKNSLSCGGLSAPENSSKGMKNKTPPSLTNRSLTFPTIQHYGHMKNSTLSSSLYSRSLVKVSKHQRLSGASFNKHATIYEDKRSSSTAKDMSLKVSSSKEFKHVLRELTC